MIDCASSFELNTTFCYFCVKLITNIRNFNILFFFFFFFLFFFFYFFFFYFFFFLWSEKTKYWFFCKFFFKNE
ncbi:hypothetical protein D9O40_21945 [Clostridium autoethanogenum]|uniref:Uncharacterized protein n=1 Tax=Clostridium autoethanogenum TaxID=84023 RepID=A0A3M0RZB2_9CLOT|nr:hypothetical protein D9O40_21945 [Clostridium autoethanogenum]